MVAAVSGNAFAQSSTCKVRLEQMHCGGCSGKVKSALTAVDGVKEVNTDLEKRIATISYDASKTNEKALLNLLKTTTKFTEAYAYNPDEVIERKAVYRAGQMRCGGCASKIKKSIGEVAGVIIKIRLQIQKSDILFCVERKHLEEVIDKPPVLLHGLHIFVEYCIFLIGHFITIGLLQTGKLFIEFECHNSILRLEIN